jgi:hypothetical protein
VSATADAAAKSDRHADNPGTLHGHWLLELLPGHAPLDCLLLDQLALGDILHSAPVELPPAVPTQALPTPPAGRTAAAHVALFQARGPPPG